MQNFLFASLVIAVIIITARANTSHADNHDTNANVMPRFSKQLMPVVVKPAGNMVRFKCPAIGNPEPNITWYKDGKTPISRNLATIRLARWSITLEDLVVSDTANYTCDVCNSMGCVNFTYKLEVLERFPSRPYIREGYLQNRTVLLNSTVQFECKTVTDLEPYIQWIKTDYAPTDSNDRILTFPNSTMVQTTDSASPEILQLHNVTFEDEGWYTCIASNSLGHSQASAYLKVVPKKSSDQDRSQNKLIDRAQHYLASALIWVQPWPATLPCIGFPNCKEVPGNDGEGQ